MTRNADQAASTAVPDSRPTCVVHIDLDGYADICRVHGWPFVGPRDVIFESGLRSALAFLARNEITATLFTIAQNVRDSLKKELLRECVGQGHEIGSHSVTHRKLTALPRSEQRSEIFESRAMLEQSLGVAVRGFRAPGFSIDGHALGMLESAGYCYDCSLFPDARTSRRTGLGKISARPHLLGSSRRLLELPMPAHAPLPVPFHPSYSLVLGMQYFRMGIRRARRTGAPLLLLFHLTDFADPLPDEALPNWKAKFYTLSFLTAAEKARRCAQMLDLVRRDYRVVTTADLLRSCETPIEASSVETMSA
jgi:peptidoglycan/xylan/chitin deacetylase (PgdA/CDA1 family)